ncbi:MULTISPECIES: AAA family ATPase [unclassified Enterococcus]|uniref:AAA family ATPase n=1 Tax=unclassified Enterococcus TaxID=2608891 RepID=UPI001903EE60|nr:MULTISPECIES: AAA family ATPase [unclassified Enterococcus]MBK0039308.1 AAA family ATPase [Enterococcus sp. S52]MBK0071973.1 AAA family ATPase [Enterococcus sp. S53]MBK0142564.1 AAA family ATPase [Enterococcus sp. S76]MBK0146255.1 AAA family ATPase [Enterococcus sp. S77]
MKLLCYLDEENKLFSFDSEYVCSVTLSENIEITIKKNEKFLSDFYGENIDLTVIAGENASGKTFTLNNIYKLSKENRLFLFIDGNTIKYYSNKKVFEIRDIDKATIGSIILDCNILGIEFSEIERENIDIETLLFSNAIEGKNKIIQDLVKKNTSNLSILHYIYDTPYKEVLNENFFKQINMIRNFGRESENLFDKYFFTLPTQLQGEVIVSDLKFNFDDEILKQIVFPGKQYKKFKQFCTGFFVDKEKMIKKLSLNQNISFFNTLISYGLKIDDMFYILGNGKDENSYLKNIWSYLNICMGTNFEYSIYGFKSMNNEIDKLKTIEEKTKRKIEKINHSVGSNNLDDLTKREYEIILKQREIFKNEIIISRNLVDTKLDDEFEDMIDIISITDIMIYIWKYISSNQILNQIENIKETELKISFEAGIDNESTLIDFVIMNNNTLNLTYSWDKISSGENCLLNFFSEIYNVEKSVSKEKNLVICMDEVDLGLHPEWQRKWVKHSPVIIEKMLNKDNDSLINRKIQFILTTHSPIILSDFLPSSVILIKDNNIINKHFKTFGANIHDLMSNQFFLEGSLMGEFAKYKIDEIIKLLKSNLETENQLFDSESGTKYDNRIIKNIISEVGEVYLREALIDLYESSSLYKKETAKKELINKIEHLKKELAEMEA